MYTILFVLLLADGSYPALGQFSFTSKAWETNDFPLIKTTQNNFLIECSTTDPTALVTLTVVRLPFDLQREEDSKVVFGERVQKQSQNFLLKRLRVQDAGKYFCRAQNDTSVIQLDLGELRVIPAEDLVIHIYPDKKVLEVERGNDVNITCEALGSKGTKHSFISWYRLQKNGRFLPVAEYYISRQDKTSSAGHHLDNEVLMLTNFTATDAGLFQCIKRYSFGTISSRNITVVEKPDVPLHMTFHGLSSVMEGGTMELVCSVGGVPSPSSTNWLKNKKIIKSCTYLEKSCIFEVQHVVYPEDNGTYTCLTRNRFHQLSKDTYITILVKPVLRRFSQSEVANYEEDHELVCDVIRSNPPPLITWERQASTCLNHDPTCDPIGDKWEILSKVRTNEETTNKLFYIANRTRRDYFYRCSAENFVGTTQTYTLLLRTGKKEFQLNFIVDNPYIVNEKDPLNITCIADAYVYRSVAILRGRQFLTKTYKVNNEKLMAIFSPGSANLSNTGIYTCLGILTRTNERRSINLNVTVKELIPAYITFTSNTITTSQDEEKHFQLDCPAIGNPPPQISWKFRGVHVSSNHRITGKEKCSFYKQGIYRVTKRDDLLIICWLNFIKQSGAFECTAKNKLSHADATIYLDIKAKPEITTPLGSLSFSSDARNDIVCRAVGSPTPIVSWFRHYAAETPDENEKIIKISSAVQTAVLNASTWKYFKSGRYFCVASNLMGNVSKTLDFAILTVEKATGGLEDIKEIIIGIAVAFFLILILVFIFILWYRRKLKNKYALYLEPNANFVIDPDRTLFDQSNDLPYDMAWEFPRNRFTFIKTLGKGAFGEVWLTEAEGITEINARDKSLEAKRRRNNFKRKPGFFPSFNKKSNKISYKKSIVAVKTLKDQTDSKQYKDLASELKILIHVGEHRNIVNLLAACTMKGKLCVILEFCPNGNLLGFLRGKRNSFEDKWEKLTNDMKDEFTNVDILKIAIDIARGMEFLVSRKCIHRDLAARNILVGLDYTMKIGDFGMAKELQNDEFYLNKSTTLLPIKWLPPESLTDKVFNSTTDVWSFGIVLWELYSLGGSPYPGISPENLLRFIEGGGRNERPDHCPSDVYEVMKNCWSGNPFNRPTFSDLVVHLIRILEEKSPQSSHYIKLSDKTTNIMAASTLYLEATGSSDDFDEHYEKDQTNRPLLKPSESQLSDISNSSLPDLPKSTELNGKSYLELSPHPERNAHLTSQIETERETQL